MSQSLAERLEAARRQQFVGRSSERDLLRETMAAAELPFVLLYIYGPGGVGKSSLLREAAHIAEQVKASVYRLDARNLETSPAGFMAGLQQALGLAEPGLVFEGLAAEKGRVMLLIDTAELLTPLESWLRDIFLPQLPPNVLVVIAGRNPPSLRWRTDPGWQPFMRLMPLRNMSQEESRAFLMRRQIPAREHTAILNFTHGHPLALSLVADMFEQKPETEFRPENAPDIIKNLLEQFMQEVPSGHHRAALEAGSQVRLLNEPLLGEMLAVEDPHPIFEWLRGLSFIDSERRGLYPHDLAREALAADLRWRDPLRQAELHNLARKFYMRRFQEGDARTQRQILSDYIFLHRENPIIRAYFDWQSTGTLFSDSFQEEDRAVLLEMVGRHEGPTAEKLAAYWLSRQPEEVVVVRRADRVPLGMVLMLALERCSPEERELDPAVGAAWDYLGQHGPLRTGERATLFRFWMAAESYQQPSPIQSRIFVNIVQHYLTKAGLAFTFIPCAEADFWQDVFNFADQQRLAEADFRIYGRHYGVYGHDWRTVPPLVWLAKMAKQELGMQLESAEAEPVIQPLPLLDEGAYTAAVQEALRNFNDELALQSSPLLQSRQLIAAVGPEAGLQERLVGLRAMMLEATETMQSHPKQVKWYRAVYHTYFQPAATQEQAAELLDLPFSTYRRHLKAGIGYIGEWLWIREGQ